MGYSMLKCFPVMDFYDGFSMSGEAQFCKLHIAPDIQETYCWLPRIIVATFRLSFQTLAEKVH